MRPFALWRAAVTAGCAEDHTVKQWEVQTGKCLRTFEGHDNEVCLELFLVSKSDETNLVVSHIIPCHFVSNSCSDCGRVTAGFGMI